MNARIRHVILGSLRLLWRYRLRSALLMLSAATGTAGVVCSVNYGAGGTKQILDQIQRMGTNVLIITPAENRGIAGRPPTGKPVATLVERDHLAIDREVLSRTRSSGLVTSSFWLKAGDLSKNATVVGSEPDYFAIKDWPATEGDVFEVTQERTASRVALLGHTVARDMFGMTSAVGERLLINRVPFTVIGVLAERGQGLDSSNEDNQVYVPLSTAMRRLMNVDHYSALIIEIDSMSEMDRAAAQIRSVLHRLHQIQSNQADDFQIQNHRMVLDTQLAAADRLEFFLRWIGGSALVVSGLAMLGITWIGVKERTREFGTRRALGATAFDVFVHVVSESTILALAGCIAGVLLSWPVSRLISQAAGLVFVFSTNAAIVAFTTVALLNIGFAFWPSCTAAHLNPTEALRHE